MKQIITPLLITLGLTLTACGGGGASSSGGPTPPPVKPDKELIQAELFDVTASFVMEDIKDTTALPLPQVAG